MVNDLQARLHSLYNARQPVGSVHGQMVGQERYKLIASGEQLYTLLEAADRIAVLEAALTKMRYRLEFHSNDSRSELWLVVNQLAEDARSALASSASDAAVVMPITQPNTEGNGK